MATKSTTKKGRAPSPTRKTKQTSVRRTKKKGGFLLSKRQKILTSLAVGIALVATGSYLIISHAASTYYRYQGIGGKCLDNNAQRKADGNKVQLWSCNTTSAQKWAIGGDNTLKNANGFCLDVKYRGTKPGTPVWLWSCNGTPAQKWQRKGNTFVNPNSGLCLDVKDAQTADGSVTQVWTCNGAAAQNWVGIKVASSGSSPSNGTGGSSGGNGTQQTGAGITLYQNLSGSTFSSRINSAGANATVSLEPKTYTFSDFKDGEQAIAPQKSAYGAWLKVKGLVGAGSKYTVIQMNENTSKKAGDVPKNCGGGTGCPTNNLYLVRMDAPNAKVDGVTIRGTSQGHLYNGLRFDNVANLTLSNSVIESIPGNSSANPGETFAVNLQHASGTARISNVTINGKGVGAAGIAANSSSATINVDGLYTTDLKYSAGIALWQQTGTVNLRNFSSINNARALGVERLGATVNIYDPNWNTPKVGHDLTYTPYSGHDSRINFYFSSSSKVPARKIVILTNTTSVKSKVHVYINGVEQPANNYVSWQGI